MPHLQGTIHAQPGFTIHAGKFQVPPLKEAKARLETVLKVQVRARIPSLIGKATAFRTA